MVSLTHLYGIAFFRLKQVAGSQFELKQIAMEMLMPVLVGQGRAMTVFAALVIGELADDAHAGLPVRPEFRDAFDVASVLAEICTGIGSESHSRSSSPGS
jgi:hypothetical protein